DLFAKGKALAERHAVDEPAAALALLEVIRPLAPDPSAELDFRRALLERLLARNPHDPEIASRLAGAHEEKGDFEACERVLTPFEGRLGALDGAATLGRAHARRGRYEQAHALLKPFVDARLPGLRAAEQEYREAVQAAEERAIDRLKRGNAPGFDYQTYDRAAKPQQKALVAAYVGDCLKNDPAARTARDALIAHRAVAGAAVDLGLVQLHRGQTLADPAARKAELEAAEKTFLSVRGFAGEDAEYRLSLGQVYHWLGRPDEARKLFDEVQAADRSTRTRLHLARVLREVGDTTGARQQAETAYREEKDAAQKYVAARMRSVLFNDLDDAIHWLGLCDPDAQEVKAALAHARG
ncbi:MAG: hypothetical protein K2V38_18150, partial [Gemmataceae bacterium]|nr:hypothetical protein [Gemmataceae bacterium]